MIPRFSILAALFARRSAMLVLSSTESTDCAWLVSGMVYHYNWKRVLK